jgi:cobaltochelatase CobN
VSGLFRDLFPAQIALLDIAVHAVAERDETAAENPLAAACRATNDRARIFGAAPGVYGAGVEDLLRDADSVDAVGRAYLDATSHAFEGAEGKAVARPGAFADRVAVADMLVHSSDDPGRDLLDGGADVAHIGGFAAAAKHLGRAPVLVSLDTSTPDAPKARTLDKALARIVRGRAANPRFIAGMMRHGPRGAAELSETVDRLVSFAQTTGAVSNGLFDLVHDAYVADEAVRNFLLRENPAAARDIAERLEQARRLGLWHPRRNDVDHDLSLLKQEPLA